MSTKFFQTAIAKSSPLDSILLRKQTSAADSSGLVHQILQTSQTLSSSSSSMAGSRNGCFSLALEEHQIELLHECRTLIKRCSSSSKGDDDGQEKDSRVETKVYCLHVAIHILRALSSFQYNDGKHQEATRSFCITPLLCHWM